MDDHLPGQLESMAQTIEAIHYVIKVNDDNKPAPENIPDPMDKPTTTIFNNEWVILGFPTEKLQTYQQQGETKFPCQGNK